MSYTRSFSKTIRVHYSGYVSYPASKTGGTVSYSGTASENVYVNVNVDTHDFDMSVEDCSNHVNVLTGAIAATEAAQVESLSVNSKKIAKTIVSGFFKTVRSDISQQISALKSEIDSTLVHLKELATRCNDVKARMGNDYRRLTERYNSIFEDLNRELRNRIMLLDKPAFDVREAADNNTYKALNSELVGTSTIGAKETSHLEALLSATRLKSLTVDAIDKIDDFLCVSYDTDDALADTMLDQAGDGTLYAPVLYVETESAKHRIDHYVFGNKEFMDADDETRLKDKAADVNWDALTVDDRRRIQNHFNMLIAEHLSGSDQHTRRVRERMQRLMNIDRINSNQ